MGKTPFLNDWSFKPIYDSSKIAGKKYDIELTPLRTFSILLLYVLAVGNAVGQAVPVDDTRKTAPVPVFPDFFPLMAWDDVENEETIKKMAECGINSIAFVPATLLDACENERWEKLGDKLWPSNTLATSDTYRKFLEQFIPQFKAMLEEEGMLDKSLFHLADEPDADEAVARYRKARTLLREVAPWMKVMDAMSEPHFATERLSDMPIPSIVTANQLYGRRLPGLGILLLRSARWLYPATI